MCSVLKGSYICTKDLCMPDEKLECDKLVNWVQFNEYQRFNQYISVIALVLGTATAFVLTYFCLL